ncbi:hypothetical protein RvY_13466 [Ramazzottius varieornatus]|uniref:DDE-1 domain-containing protein n=1 Tax=Ramazzottius varieornatus TaxID=947166 RepID=A0A1D1VPS9_RAMVA|nr:hypothetical protein RvY_13466 [Ramazzottius varieornatus]
MDGKLKTASQVHKELSVEAALREVKDGESLTSAAKTNGVSRTTLRSRMEKPNPSRVGAPTKFPPWEEDRLVDFLMSCSDQRIPLNRYHCVQLFCEVAIGLGTLEQPMEILGLKNTSVNDKYVQRFLSRHSDLSLRITHSSNRKKDREWTVERFEEYISKLQALRVRGFLERPVQVWNLEETAFTTSEMYDSVIARKGAKQIPSQFDGTEKENVTILPCGNASGVQLRFMALYAGKVHVQSRLDDTFGLCYHAVNASGYMDQVHFANYIKTELIPAVTELKNVVFVDGHFSQVNNLLLVRYCKELYEKTAKQVEIFCLPTGQTNHLQPFDVSVSGGIKKKWRMYLRDRRLVKGGIVTKNTVLCHIVKLWYRTEGWPEKYAFNGEQCLKSGFAKVGLFPFNPDVIRKNVKAHQDPEVISRGIHSGREQEFSPLFELLKAHYGLMTEKDLADNGVTPGAELANSIQKDLFGEAPKKQRRETNRQLSLSAGALITHPSFVEQLEKDEAAKNAKKVAAAAKREAPPSQPAKQAKNTSVKKQRKA